MVGNLIKALFLTIALTTAPGLLSAQTVTVGWDDACDYDVRVDADAVNTAINAANAEIRVSNENDYLSHILIKDDLILKGGFNNCTLAATGTASTTLTRIDGTSILPTALKIYPDNVINSVEVSGFLIENATGFGGGGSSGDEAAAFAIVATRGTVSFSNMVITNNHDESGSGGVAIRSDYGVYPDGHNLNVYMDDVLITNNSAGSTGGGMSCYAGNSNTSVTISGYSGISFNHSDAQGGGIFNNGCVINFYSGTSTPGIADPRGIHKNTANSSGGGVAMYDDESTFNAVGSQAVPVNISANRANLDEAGSGDGGGFFLSGDSKVEADRVWIYDNETNKNGGGVHIQYGARFFMRTNERGCNWNTLCNSIENNRAFRGGGIQSNDGSNVILNGLEATGNRAFAGVFYYNPNDDGSFIMESGLLHHNGNSDHSEFADETLISQAGDSTLVIRHSTLADNDVQYATIQAYNGAGEGYLSLRSSIVDDSGIPAVGFVQPGITTGHVRCVIINDASTLNDVPQTLVYVETPMFADRPNQDYHITPPPNTAIDQCKLFDGESEPGPDLDGEVRRNDLNEVVNAEGNFDIGVDEFYLADTENIFINGFE